MRRAFVWMMLWVLATGAAAAAGRIPTPPWFEQAYWDQLVFGCAEQPDLCRPNNPNGRTIPTTDRVSTMDVHLVSETDPPLPQQWEDTYRRVIPLLMTEFAGGRQWSGSLTTGSEPLERAGVIDVVFVPDDCASGGFWGGGGNWVRGIVRLSMRQDRGADWCLRTVLLAHELGHATGFQHVDDPDDFMCTDTTSRTGRCDGHAWSQPYDGQPVFSERQRLHIRLARQVADDEGGWFNWPGVDIDSVSAPPTATCELKLESDGFEICYDERYLEDAEFARNVLDRATRRFRSRYGVRGTFSTVHLLGEPGTVDCDGRDFTIDVGIAVHCGGSNIFLLTRSAPQMNRCCTQLGFHYQSDEYQITVLNHEYSTSFQHNFPGFYDKPRWFYDGLQQYEGFFAVDRLHVWRAAAEKTWNDNSISCGEGLMGETLSIVEPYAAGATYFRYLADRFGEQIHIDMIGDSRANASQILAELTGETPCVTFGHFRTWMYEEFGLGSPTPVPALPLVDWLLDRLFP